MSLNKLIFLKSEWRTIRVEIEQNTNYRHIETIRSLKRCCVRQFNIEMYSKRCFISILKMMFGLHANVSPL